MAKANIIRKYSLNASGILHVDVGEFVGIENVQTGEIVQLDDLLADFDGRAVKMSVNYDEEYESDTNQNESE